MFSCEFIELFCTDGGVIVSLSLVDKFLLLDDGGNRVLRRNGRVETVIIGDLSL